MQNNPAKPIIVINTTRKETFSPPKVIPITAANLPKTIHAGKPVVKIDSLKEGVPFFTNYGTEQGLPLTAVTCGFTDKAGNLWFGTQGGGVSRYDGKSFTNYNIENGLADTYLICIMQDAIGNLWFGTNAGLSEYDGNSFINYTASHGLAGKGINCMMQDRQGYIWFGTGSGVFKYDGNSFKNCTTFPGLPCDKIGIGSIIQDKAGKIWFGTQGKGAIKYDGNSFTNYTTSQGLVSNDINCMMQDIKGNIWFGTNHGITKYDGNSFTNYTTAQGLASNKVRSISEDNRANIWLGTNEGLSKYDGNGFINYTTAQGLADNKVMCIIHDKTGNMWFGTFEGGISEYSGNSFTNYTTVQGLANNEIYSIIQDRSGNLWFATQEGASEYNGKGFANYSTIQGLAANDLDPIFQDSKDNIWFGTFDKGVSKYDGKSFTNYTTAQGLTANYVGQIIEDKAGNIWFGSSGGGLSKFDGKSFTHYTTAQGLLSNNIFSMIMDKAGNIWVGTLGGGVSKYDGINFTNYTKAEGLASNRVTCIMEDKKGNLWFGTDGEGVSKYDDKSFTNYTTAQGLGDNEIYEIVEDTARNIIWFGTNLGLSGLKQSSRSNNNVQGNTFENFNNHTGYPIKDLNSYGLCLDNKGILWAACGDNKVIRFDYSALNKNKEPLSLEIQDIKVNNENICWNNQVRKSKGNKAADSLVLLNEMITTFGKVLPTGVLDSMQKRYGDIEFDSMTRFYPVPVNLVLPYKDNNISIDFLAVEPAMPKQVKYQYKLEGNDKNWSPLSNNTSAFFGNLYEGNYTFKLKALSPYGIWSETAYKFRVLPPWQRTWWAYLIYTLSFIGIVWGFIYYRSKQLRRENRLLEEKVNLRTHQLKEEKEKVESTLAELKSTQAQLIQSEKMASLGELTAGIAHEIQNPLNFVNNFSEVNTELLAEMREEIVKGNYEEVNTLAKDIEDNEQKINLHGKRAEAIVKGMLQHSRKNTGQKELTDINALADEYLRLSYNGIRAKDKTFNATLQTGFDETIGKINIIPQDMGRVLLNLFNNAFYAVNEKKKKRGDGYQPTVSISTSLNPPSGSTGAVVEIRVKDNGNGIPQKVIDKIYQPFFTTKPAGEGTGLGLSLSYDITTKQHNGSINAVSKEGEGTEFIIQLPVI